MQNKTEKIATRNKIQLLPNKDLGLIEVKDYRTPAKKIKTFIQAIFNLLRSFFVKMSRFLGSINAKTLSPKLIEEKKYIYQLEDLPWHTAKESNGIYFLIHGLRGTPEDWEEYQEEIRRVEPNVHIFTPSVPLEGNCSLATAGQPLLKVLENYLQKFPGKPVTLIGTSNGGRIVAYYIESHLDPTLLGTSTLSVVSLAGVLFGTKFIDSVKSAGVLPLLNLNEEVENEYFFGNPSAQLSLHAWQMKQKVWKENARSVQHLFCATTNDEVVWENACSFPYHEDADSTYMIVSGESHVSIVDAMKQDVFSWLRSRSLVVNS